MSDQLVAPAPPSITASTRSSTTSLVLGIASFTALSITVLVPVAAVVFGAIGLRREPAGRTQAIIGVVLGVWGIASAIALLMLFAVLPGLLGGLGELLNELDIDGTRGPRGL